MAKKFLAEAIELDKKNQEAELSKQIQQENRDLTNQSQVNKVKFIKI